MLVNVLLVSVINFTVWFADHLLGLHGDAVGAGDRHGGRHLPGRDGARAGIWFGSLVDRYRKKTVMQVSTLVSLGFYAVGLALYLPTPDEAFRRPVTSVRLWVFIVLCMVGMIAGNLRGIALPTLVTALIEPSGGIGRTGWSGPRWASPSWSPR